MQTVRVQARITAVDIEHNTASFIGPAGGEQTIEVTEPQMQAFIRTLKTGYCRCRLHEGIGDRSIGSAEIDGASAYAAGR